MTESESVVSGSVMFWDNLLIPASVTQKNLAQFEKM